MLEGCEHVDYVCARCVPNATWHRKKLRVSSAKQQLKGRNRPAGAEALEGGGGAPAERALSILHATACVLS